MSHIHRAARLGNVADIERGIARGEDVDAIGIHGFSPLMLAAREGHAAIVQMLLAAGADVNASHKNGRSVLEFAAAVGDLEIVRLLVASGAEVDGIEGRKTTPALAAAQMNHPAVVAFLLANGANSDAQDRTGRTAAEWLAVGGMVGESRNDISEMQMPFANGDKPPADVKSEELVARLAANGLSAEKYCAVHGRRTLVWGFGRYKFADFANDEWVQNVSDILFTPGRLDACEEQYLLGKDLEDARKMRARRQRLKIRDAVGRP